MNRLPDLFIGCCGWDKAQAVTANRMLDLRLQYKDNPAVLELIELHAEALVRIEELETERDNYSDHLHKNANALTDLLEEYDDKDDDAVFVAITEVKNDLNSCV